MNKKTFLAALLAVCLMLTLAACGGSEPAEQAQPSGDATTTTTTAPEATAPTAPTPADGEVLYTIKVVDPEGNPKAGVYVQICLETCMPYPTDSQGMVYYCGPEADYKISLMPDSTAPEGYVAVEHHFEAGSHEMTLVYDYALQNAAASNETEPNTNDVQFDNWG